MPRKVKQDLLAGSDTESESVQIPLEQDIAQPEPTTQVNIPKKRRPTPSDEHKAKMREGRILQALAKKERLALKDAEIQEKLERLSLLNYIDDDILTAAMSIAKHQKEQATGVPATKPAPTPIAKPEPVNPVVEPPEKPKRKYTRRQPLATLVTAPVVPTRVSPKPQPTQVRAPPKIVPPKVAQQSHESESESEPESEYTTNPELSSTSDSEYEIDRMPISSLAPPSMNPAFMLYRGRRMGR